MKYEDMSQDKVRAVVNTLRTEKIHGRHVECTCKRGGGSFHGKVHLFDGKYYLEPKPIHIVRAAMQEEGYTRRSQAEVEDLSAWSKSHSSQNQTKRKPAPAKIQPGISAAG